MCPDIINLFIDLNTFHDYFSTSPLGQVCLRVNVGVMLMMVSRYRPESEKPISCFNLGQFSVVCGREIERF